MRSLPTENYCRIGSQKKAGERFLLWYPSEASRASWWKCAATTLPNTWRSPPDGQGGEAARRLDELSKLLGLDKPPMRIESYDISNLAGGDNVAGMVVFENGRPKKSDYRKFKIKTIVGQDDYGSMAEALTRRFNEYRECQAKGETTGFGALPDLILLDGGKGHVNAVRPVFRNSLA